MEGLLDKLPFEGLGDGDFGVIGFLVLPPVEMLVGVEFSAEDGFTMDAEDSLSARGEVLVAPFNDEVPVGVIVERAEGEIDKVDVKVEIVRMFLEK